MVIKLTADFSCKHSTKQFIESHFAKRWRNGSLVCYSSCFLLEKGGVDLVEHRIRDPHDGSKLLSLKAHLLPKKGVDLRRYVP